MSLIPTERNEWGARLRLGEIVMQITKNLVARYLVFNNLGNISCAND